MVAGRKGGAPLLRGPRFLSVAGAVHICEFGLKVDLRYAFVDFSVSM
jgi:hypothetical protein